MTVVLTGVFTSCRHSNSNDFVQRWHNDRQKTCAHFNDTIHSFTRELVERLKRSDAVPDHWPAGSLPVSYPNTC